MASMSLPSPNPIGMTPRSRAILHGRSTTAPRSISIDARLTCSSPFCWASASAIWSSVTTRSRDEHLAQLAAGLGLLGQRDIQLLFGYQADADQQRAHLLAGVLHASSSFMRRTDAVRESMPERARRRAPIRREGPRRW